MQVKFANGLIYDASTLDEAIKKCLASGHDPFKPVIIESEQENITIEHNEDTE